MEPLAVCLVGPAEAAVESLSAVGTVTASGPGSPAVGTDELCNPVIGRPAFVRDNQADGWFVVETLDGLVTYAVWLRGDFVPPGVGTSVEVDHELTVGELSPTVAWFDLQSSEFAVWMGTGGGVEDLSTAPLELSEGDRAGRERDECLTYELHDLIVEGEDVPYGESAVVGSATVYHGGITKQVGESRCPDAFAAEATVAIRQ